MASLKYKILVVIIGFFLVYFKNSLEYHFREAVLYSFDAVSVAEVGFWKFSLSYSFLSYSFSSFWRSTLPIFSSTYNFLLILASYTHQPYLVVIHRSLNVCKSPQVSRTFHSILTDLNNAVDWMVLILPPVSNSSSLSSKFFRTIPSAPTTISITVTFTYYIFFLILWLSLIICLPFCFILFSLCGPLGRQNALDSNFLFLLIIPGTRWSVCISKSLILVCAYTIW